MSRTTERVGELLGQITEQRANDIDETRRLCYMLLVSSKTDRHELVGTLVNAFMHHGRIPDCDEEQATGHLIRLANAEDHDGTSAAWLKRLMGDYLVG